MVNCMFSREAEESPIRRENWTCPRIAHQCVYVVKRGRELIFIRYTGEKRRTSTYVKAGERSKAERPGLDRKEQAENRELPERNVTSWTLSVLLEAPFAAKTIDKWPRGT
jgi:hypothetical protein